MNTRKGWITDFLSREENKFFCRVEDKYIRDKFNFFGLEDLIPNYKEVVKVITDQNTDSSSTEHDEESKLLYGLLHARYIKDARGMIQMVGKYNNKDFGVCQRNNCNEQALVPIGINDEINKEFVRLYCSKCEDIYLPQNEIYKKIDGAFFGTSFPHLLFLNVPKLIKPIKNEKMNKYIPKVYGFKLHKKWHKVAIKELGDHTHYDEIFGDNKYDENDENHHENKELNENDHEKIKKLEGIIKEQMEEIERLKKKEKKLMDEDTKNEDDDDDKIISDDLKYLEQKMDEFGNKYNKENIFKICNKSLDLVSIKEDINRMDLKLKSFGEYIIDLNVYIESLINLDIDGYKEWNVDTIIQWISLLNDGKYKKYADGLRAGFDKNGIHHGVDLTNLNENNLGEEPFNISNVNDRTDLINYFISLKKHNK